MNTTIVIGASLNPTRYSHKVILKLHEVNEHIIAIGNKSGFINQTPIFTEFLDDISKVKTVTLYINPKLQEQYYDKIIALKPKRIIFNPGTENDVFEKLAIDNGIEVMHACSLVMLNIGVY